MFDKKFISDYKSIDVPDELYDNIINGNPSEAKRNIKVYVRSAAALVAVFAVAFISVFVLTRESSNPVIFIDGEQLTTDVAISEKREESAMFARTMNELKVPVKLEIKKETRVIPSEGMLFGEDGEMISADGNEIILNGNASFQWVLPSYDNTKQYHIELKDEDGTYFINLSFDSRAQIWSARLTK